MRKTLRYVRYAEDAKFRGHNAHPPFEGDPVTDVTVPVASRIPDEVLDHVRRVGGGLRLKLRLTPDTVLVGWDVESRPNPDGYSKREIEARNIAILPAWSHTGGDFKEARPAFYIWLGDGLPRPRLNTWTRGDLMQVPAVQQLGGAVPKEFAVRGIVPGNVFYRERGWYIDPKTGQKIETDF